VAGVAVGGAEEDLDDLADLVLAQEVRAEAQDVAVVVLAGPAGGHLVVHQRRPHPPHLVRRHRHADAAAVHQDGGVTAAVGDGAGRGGGVVGVVHRRRPVAAEIFQVVAEFFQERDQPPLGFVSTVIAGDGEFHGSLTSVGKRGRSRKY
jgi:hypothetical protein